MQGHASTRVRWTLFTLAAGIAALNTWRYAGYLLDDTFISLRYAKHLVEGKGLIFNPGEYVEGYTNLLFVLAAAACLRLGIDPLLGTKLLISGAALVALALLVRLERLGPGRASGPGTVLLLLLPLEGLTYWATASFETMLFASLLIAALWLLLLERATGHPRGAVAAFILLALTRPEGLLLFAAATVLFAAADVWRGDRRALRRHAANLVLFGAVYAAYFAWRYWYYGDVLPNTYRAKVTGGWEQLAAGALYLRQWARTYPLLVAALVLPATLLSASVRRIIQPRAPMVLIYLVAIVYAAYVVLVGGDFMPFHRFFVPLLLLSALFLAWALAALRASSTVLTAVCLLHSGISMISEEPYRAFVAHRTAVVGQRVGAQLARMLAPDDLIAVNTAGSLPYYSERPAIDMLGLTDPAIARRPVYIVSPGWAGHRRGWGTYVLDRHPRLIFFYNASGSREPFYLSDHELADDPYFRFFYRLRSLTAPAPENQRAVARFLGFPFGYSESGQSPWPDLGLRAEFRRALPAHTTFFEAATIAHYFERDRRDDALWALREKPAAVDAFLSAVARQWAAEVVSSPAADSDARQAVDALCAEAYAKIQAGDRQAAKALLSAALRRNEAGRSPLVYQYVANVAVLDGDLFTAVGAQKEAFRLEPTNDLYRANLRSLLVKAYEDGSLPSSQTPVP